MKVIVLLEMVSSFVFRGFNICLVGANKEIPLPSFVSGLPRPEVCCQELLTFVDVLQSVYNQDTFAFSP